MSAASAAAPHPRYAVLPASVTTIPLNPACSADRANSAIDRSGSPPTMTSSFIVTSIQPAAVGWTHRRVCHLQTMSAEPGSQACHAVDVAGLMGHPACSVASPLASTASRGAWRTQ
jgi:hypothetical protein